MSLFRITRARELRQTQTLAEAAFWQYVRGRRLANAKFKRQRPFGRYFLDFFCEELDLVVELDGAGHLEEQTIARDNERTAFLQSRGLTVVRIGNRELLDDASTVFARLERVIVELRRLRNPAAG